MPGFNITGEERGPNRAPPNEVETLRTNRWFFQIDPVAGRPFQFYAQSCSRPTPEIDEIAISHGQDTIYRPGRYVWNPIEFSIYEAYSNGGPRRRSPSELAIGDLYRWWGTTMIAKSDYRQGTLSDFLATATVEMLDGIGDPVWKYRLFNCWPSKISPSELNYADSEIATVTVTLRYDRAYLVPSDSVWVRGEVSSSDAPVTF